MINDGFHIFSETPDVIKSLIENYNPGDFNSWPKRKKGFLRMDPNISSKSLPQPFIEFARWALPIAQGYLGDSAGLYSVNVSCAFPGATKWSASQLYHCDWRDTHTLKFFVYLSDIGPENGPFTFIGAETSKHIREKLKYNTEISERVPDDVIYSVAKDKENVITGPAGTVCAIDTCSCFHYGGRVSGSHRLMAMFQFLRPGHKKPYERIKL